MLSRAYKGHKKSKALMLHEAAVTLDSTFLLRQPATRISPSPKRSYWSDDPIVGSSPLVKAI